MSEFEDFGAKRLNEAQCERIGAALRKALGGGDADRMPPILEMFENARRNVPGAKNLLLVVRDEDDMDGALAFAIPEKQEVHVDMAFVDKATRDSHDARTLGLHEIVHVLFHEGVPRFFRKSEGNIVYSFLNDRQTRTEWQADRILRAVFMPTAMVGLCSNALELATLAGVPINEAVERINELKEGEARATPNDIAQRIASLARDASKSTPAFNRLNAEALKLQLWNALPTIEGEEPNVSRLCGKFRVWWSDFGKTTECGWFIESGKVVSFYGSRG